MGAISSKSTSSSSSGQLLDLKLQVDKPVLTELKELTNEYISLYEFLCVLVLCSYSCLRQKLQCKFHKQINWQKAHRNYKNSNFIKITLYYAIHLFALVLFGLFDFRRQNIIKLKAFLLLYRSTLCGYCRFTGQPLPKPELLDSYLSQFYVKSDNAQALQKPILPRKLLEQVDGSRQIAKLFDLFNQTLYENTKENDLVLSFQCAPKFSQKQEEQLYAMLEKAYKIRLYDKSKQVEQLRELRRNQRNRSKISQLIELKANIGLGKLSLVSPILRQSKEVQSPVPKVDSKGKKIAQLNTINRIRSQSSSNISKSLQTSNIRIKASKSLHRLNNKSLCHLITVNGRQVSPQKLLDDMKYFKTLANSGNSIRFKEFINSLTNEPLMKKQIANLYKFFDPLNKGTVTFNDFLKVKYPGILKTDCEQVCAAFEKYWQVNDQQIVFSQSSCNIVSQQVELPSETTKRIDEIFEVIDKGRKGYLTLEDLKEAYSTAFTIQDLERMVKQSGVNGRITKEAYTKRLLPKGWYIAQPANEVTSIKAVEQQPE